MDVIGLHFSGANFFGKVLSNGLAETKLAILAFLYCGEFVKSSTRVSSERVPEWHFIITVMKNVFNMCLCSVFCVCVLCSVFINCVLKYWFFEHEIKLFTKIKIFPSFKPHIV